MNSNKLGITDIGVYLPRKKEDNFVKQEKFGLKQGFLEEKIGVFKRSICEENEFCSDLCVRAFEDLRKRTGISTDDIEAAVVVTQNPDSRLPHAGAIVHSKLNLSEKCASFDISLGCSGFVYGLSVISSFMESNGLKKGVLFTSDPYSKIVDPEDRNTALIFGDGATATLITGEPVLRSGIFSFGTMGSRSGDICLKNDRLFMNGQSVVKFAKRTLIESIRNNIEINGLAINDIDRFIIHQGSRFIVDTISNDLEIELSKVPFDIWEYGNTVSSSIPVILKDELSKTENETFLISGFGVGLSWGSCVLRRL